MMNEMLAVCAGVALAAACGFRVFVPLLVASIAVRAGAAQAVPSMTWIGSDLALGMLGVATVAELIAYYVPWLDHALDTLASPAAVVAGTLAAGVFVPGSTDPALHWALMMIIGGGAAGVVQTGTVLTRAVSGGTTLGLANPVVATVENAGALALSGLALFLPVAGAILALVVLVTVVFCLRRLVALFRSRRTIKPAAQVTPLVLPRLPEQLPDLF